MKILIVCRSFNNMAGGIERMAAALMNEMCAYGHDVSLLTWDLAGAKSFYKLDARIKWYNLDHGTHETKAGWILRFKRMFKMRSILKEISPDVIMAFQHGTFLSTRLYSLGQGFPIIAAEREAPARFKYLKSGKWQWLIYQSFRLSKRITIQCESYREDYPDYLHSRITTISNPVFPAKSYSSPEGMDDKRKVLLCVGRLGYQKNQSVLIKAFSILYKEFPQWDLVFAGEGGDRAMLEKDVKALGLNSRISFLGAVKDISQLYCSSHLLCLPARWEGFPNAIAESLAHGLPAVGFLECAGTRDLIIDGVNGALAEGNCDPDTLAQALKALMEDDVLRKNMGKRGVDSMASFMPDNIFKKWNALFKEVGNN